MKFGVALPIANPKGVNYQVYQGYIQGGVLAEKLGFDHVWSTEHHFLPNGWSPSQMPILANIAAQTERIRLGTYVLLAPFHNPIRIAEDIATVDILSNGRLDLGVGPGGNPPEYPVFGVPFTQRRPRMYECLDIIERCLYEDSFSYKGKYYEFENVRMTTKPVQKRIPIYIAALGEKALAEAGARGYHIAGGGPPDTKGNYENALIKAGHNPRDFQRAQLHVGHVAETRDKAWDEAEFGIQHHATVAAKMFQIQQEKNLLAPSIHLVPTQVPPVGELRKTGRGPYGPAFVGSPEDIIKMLEEELKTQHMTEVVWAVAMALDGRVIKNSLELFAKEVIPHFRNK